MIRQIEEGNTKRGIIIPKEGFKEFVEFLKMPPVGKKEKLLYSKIQDKKEGNYVKRKKTSSYSR
jgi:hypothetical protein